jgi:hypothetical protein
MNSEKLSSVVAVLFMAFIVLGCGTAANGQSADSPTSTEPDVEVSPGKSPGTMPAIEKPVEEAKPGVKADLSCSADADCVYGECCHPTTCVAKSSKPNCEGVMCTMDCRGNTMDCGGGSCVCNEGTCEAKMNPPRIPGGGPPRS